MVQHWLSIANLAKRISLTKALDQPSVLDDNVASMVVTETGVQKSDDSLWDSQMMVMVVMVMVMVMVVMVVMVVVVILASMVSTVSTVSMVVMMVMDDGGGW